MRWTMTPWLCRASRASVHSLSTMATIYVALPSVPVQTDGITGVGSSSSNESIGKGGRDELATTFYFLLFILYA